MSANGGESDAGSLFFVILFASICVAVFILIVSIVTTIATTAHRNRRVARASSNMLDQRFREDAVDLSSFESTSVVDDMPSTHYVIQLTRRQSGAPMIAPGKFLEGGQIVHLVAIEDKLHGWVHIGIATR